MATQNRFARTAVCEPPARGSNEMYRWVEHVGELELEIEAPTEEAIILDAFSAFAELVVDEGDLDGTRHEIDLEAGDLEALLVAWLEELIYLADAERFIPQRVTDLHLRCGRLHAVVRGRVGVPRQLVKAITLHGLHVQPEAEVGWRARVVLDV
jgi:SHS2 domain-containing protein